MPNLQFYNSIFLNRNHVGSFEITFFKLVDCMILACVSKKIKESMKASYGSPIAG